MRILVTLLLFSMALMVTSCSHNIKFKTNTLQGKDFAVTFQTEDVTAYSEIVKEERRTFYSGNCTIKNTSKNILAVLSIEDIGGVKNRKTSLQSGVLLSPGDSTAVDSCFYQSLEVIQPIQVFYKNGEKLLSDKFSPELVKP